MNRKLSKCAGCWTNTGRRENEPAPILYCQSSGRRDWLWTLLHSLWEGAVISGVLGAALVTLRSPRARYAAACAAMLTLLAVFGLTLVWMMPEAMHGIRVSGLPALPASNIPTGQNSPIPWEMRLASAVPWLAPLWILGVLLLYVRRLAGRVSVRTLRRRGVCCASGSWPEELARLRLRLRVSRPVSLLESCLADVPVVLGHFRPFILVPAGLLAGLPSGQIEARGLSISLSWVQDVVVSEARPHPNRRSRLPAHDSGV